MEKTVKKWVIISAIIFAVIMSLFICINSYAIVTSQSGGASHTSSGEINSHGELIINDGDNSIIIDSKDIQNNRDALFVFSQEINDLQSRMNECFQSASNGKKNLSQTLAGYGIAVAEDATYEEICEAIDQLYEKEHVIMVSLAQHKNHPSEIGVGNETRTYDLKQYTDKWAELEIGKNLFISFQAGYIGINSAYGTSVTCEYNKETGILTLKGGDYSWDQFGSVNQLWVSGSICLQVSQEYYNENYIY